MGTASGQGRCAWCQRPYPSDMDLALLPFCSRRCRLQDLSKWLSGEYRVATAPVTADEAEAVVRLWMPGGDGEG